MASGNQTRPHCVNQMEKTRSKRLAARHGRVTAWARHAMCESALRRPCIGDLQADKCNNFHGQMGMRVRHGMKSIKEREYLVDRGVERRTTIKGVSENESISIMTVFTGTGRCPQAGPYKHSNQTSVSIKSG